MSQRSRDSLEPVGDDRLSRVRQRVPAIIPPVWTLAAAATPRITDEPVLPQRARGAVPVHAMPATGGQA